MRPQPSFKVKYKVTELLNITELEKEKIIEENDFLRRLRKLLPNITSEKLYEIFTKQFVPCLNNFKEPDKIVFFLEEKSVDPYYKNTFANFFVFKSDNIERYVMKIAFFMDKDDSITTDLFFGEGEGNAVLQENCIGFLTLKPILSNIINRAVINPKYIKGIEDDFHIRTCKVPFSINGVTLQAQGFPFFSQNQYARCAEVSILSLTSYYSNRYSNHKDLYPSEIHTILKNKRSTGTTPSNGETVANMNRVLQKIGFSTKVLQYKKGTNGDDNQEMLMKSVAFFIESGIPIILTLNGSFKASGEDFLHTLLCIGRTKNWNQNSNISKPTSTTFPEISSFYDSWKENDFIFLDDKLPFLTTGKLNNIGAIYTSVYENRELNVKIDHVIIPMHRSIWLQPELLEISIKELLKKRKVEEKNYNYRYLLSSARNIREFSNKYFPEIIREILLQVTFRTKFLVLIEIRDETCMVGFILVDTTSEHIEDGIVFASVDNVLFWKDEDTNELTRFKDQDGYPTTISNAFRVEKYFLNFLE